MSNGEDDEGNHGVTQCEIDIETGKKLTPSKTIWTGAGGRFLESPHLYKIKGEYYLMAAEGGTEYGHMIVYAKGKTLTVLLRIILTTQSSQTEISVDTRYKGAVTVILWRTKTAASGVFILLSE